MEVINDNPIYVTRSSMPPYEEYIEAIKPLWESHWLTNMGEFHQKLEQKLKEYLDVSRLSLMVNGHMALELAIQAMDFPQGSEVITTPFTFVSTTHAIVRNRLKPVFCDVKVCDGTIDETKIETLITKNTVAIVPVHVYGNVCNIEEIQRIADKHNLKVIYDAAHAFGVSYKGRGIGNYGDASVFSFHATKVFNTVEGGAVTFSDQKLYDRLYDLKNFGIRGEEIVVEVGANAKMNEFCAIMGLCNLRHIQKVFDERRKQYEFYYRNIKELEYISILGRNVDASRNYAYFPILIDKNNKMNRDNVYEYMRTKGIYLRKYFYPLTSDQICFKNIYSSSSVECARELSSKVLVLPIYEGLTELQINRIVDALKDTFV